MKTRATVLPTWERRANFALWIVGVAYSLYNFYAANRAFLDYDDVYNDFKRGWLFPHRIKDVSDDEWESAQEFLVAALPWMLFHAVLTGLFGPSLYVRLGVSSAFLLAHFGVRIVGLLLLQPLVFETVRRRCNVPLVWAGGGVCLLAVTLYKSIGRRELELLGIDERRHVATIMAVFWINLRCLSFHLDRIKQRRTEGFVEMVAYALYLPTLFCGPFLPYGDYERSLDGAKFSVDRLARLFRRLLRVAFWWIFTEAALHFVYVNATGFQPDLVNSFDSWTLYGYGYAMGQFFHLKYVVLYGVGAAFAEFEGATVLRMPRCIGRVHLYSDMWRHFDVGLYKFLLRYIYVPTLMNNSSLSKMASSFLCFAFVYLWHGLQNYVLFWTFLNFVGVTVEGVFKTWYFRNETMFEFVSARWKRRTVGAIAAPLLAVSAITNFYFFAGMEVGNVFFARLFFRFPQEQRNTTSLPILLLPNVNGIKRLGGAKLRAVN